jgi:flagellar basal-body rod modification protein FlgD
VNQISDLTQATATQGGGLIPVGGSTLGQQDFLRLLVTQLQAQDPLNPQDSTEFTAQLAQFSSLEQLMNVNSMLDQLAAFEAAIANTQAASLIGRDVLALGNGISVTDGEASFAEITLGAEADEVTVTIRDDAGSVIRVLDLGELGAGDHTVAWDGLTDGGSLAPNGNYTFEVSAKADGEDVSVETHIRGRVEGIDFDINGTFLLVAGRRISLGDVISIREAVTSPAADTSAEDEGLTGVLTDFLGR